MKDIQTMIAEEIEEIEVKSPGHGKMALTYGLQTRSGARISIRAATLLDDEGLRRMFSRSSSETIRRRFHMPYREVPRRMLAIMLDSGESLGAVAGGEIVGHAMYVKIGHSAEAEMAIVVEDGWRSKGVGKSLLSELAERARSGGIEAFIGEVLAENRRMLGLAAMFAGTGYTVEDGTYRVRMPLGVTGPAANTARTLRRAA